MFDINMAKEKVEKVKETKEVENKDTDASVDVNEQKSKSTEIIKSMKIEDALKKLREDKKRKFVQTVDLIVNLEKFDVRTESINTFIQLPNPTQKKICAFLDKRIGEVDVITENEFNKYKEQKEIKRLAKKYDFFIASALLMPKIATKFGRVFGPIGKMPSPQAGIMPNEDSDTIKSMIDKMKKLVRIKTKEKSIKVPVGKEDLGDDDIKENVESVVNSLKNILPKNKDNIKNIMLKFTMTKPIKLEIK